MNNRIKIDMNMFAAIAESILIHAPSIPYTDVVTKVRGKIESSFLEAKTEIVPINSSPQLYAYFASEQQLTEFLLKWGD